MGVGPHRPNSQSYPESVDIYALGTFAEDIYALGVHTSAPAAATDAAASAAASVAAAVLYLLVLVLL